MPDKERYHLYTEKELLALMAGGDEKAFIELYNIHHKGAYLYLLNLVKVREVAEDLLHEVFMKIWEVRERLDIHSSFAAYIYRICHNSSVKMLKQATKDRTLRQRIIDDAVMLTEGEQVTEKQLRRYDELVEEALATLPGQRRKVFTMVRLQGQRYQAVAKELDISVNTVKDHLGKATASLKEFIKNKGDLALAIILLENIL